MVEQFTNGNTDTIVGGEQLPGATPPPLRVALDVLISAHESNSETETSLPAVRAALGGMEELFHDSEHSDRKGVDVRDAHEHVRDGMRGIYTAIQSRCDTTQPDRVFQSNIYTQTVNNAVLGLFALSNISEQPLTGGSQGENKSSKTLSESVQEWLQSPGDTAERIRSVVTFVRTELKNAESSRQQSKLELSNLKSLLDGAWAVHGVEKVMAMTGTGSNGDLPSALGREISELRQDVVRREARAAFF